MKPLIPALLVALLVGVFLGRWSVKVTKPAVSEPRQAEIDALKQDQERLVKELSGIKDAKVEAAPDAGTDLTRAPEEAGEAEEGEPPSLDAGSPDPRTDEALAGAPSQTESSGPSPQLPPPSSAWTGVEVQLPTLGTDKVDTFLAKAAIQDLKGEIKGARPIAPGDARIGHLQGYFAGDVTPLDANDKPLRMELETTIDVQEGAVMGGQKVRIFRDGQKISESSSEGSVAGMTNPASETKAILIRPGGQNRIFQLYYLESADMLIGNFYEISEAGDFALKGRVKLTRG